jgi:hypothetical protein
VRVLSSAASGGARTSKAFPLFIPKFEDADQSLHIEVEERAFSPLS